MSSGKSLFESAIIMIICLAIGFVMNIAILMPVDMIRDNMALAGIYQVDAAWLSSTEENFINYIIYAIAYFIPLYGIIQFIVAAVRRQKYDQYGNMYYD